MEIKKLKIKDINPAKYNPRKISEEELSKLRNSMEKWGYVEPLVWNERTD